MIFYAACWRTLRFDMFFFTLPRVAADTLMFDSRLSFH